MPLLPHISSLFRRVFAFHINPVSTNHSFQPLLNAGAGWIGFALAWADAPTSPWYCSWSTSCAGRGLGEARFWIRATIIEGAVQFQNHRFLIVGIFRLWCKRPYVDFGSLYQKAQVVRVVVSQNHPQQEISANYVWLRPVVERYPSKATLLAMCICIPVSCVHSYPYVCFWTRARAHTHTLSLDKFSDRYPASFCWRTPCWNWTRNSRVISWLAQRLRPNRT